jgi:hypothetical protein
MSYVSQFLLALVITWLVEIPILLFSVHVVVNLKNVPVTRTIFTGIFANALSLPYLWFVFPSYLGAAYYLPAGELVVIALEAVILNQLLRTRPGMSLALSTVMNAASFVVGWRLMSL